MEDLGKESQVVLKLVISFTDVTCLLNSRTDTPSLCRHIPLLYPGSVLTFSKGSRASVCRSLLRVHSGFYVSLRSAAETAPGGPLAPVARPEDPVRNTCVSQAFLQEKLFAVSESFLRL